MKYNELTLRKHKAPTRAGRGISAGRGKTAGRGTKGQGARAGSGARPGFEGGQIPLYMRLPKLKGFKSLKSKNFIVYTGQLDGIKKTIVDTEALYEAALIPSPYENVKLILKGDITSKKDVRLASASQHAVEAIEKAGGSFSQTTRIPRPKKNKPKES
jgi:large subunit ribosomal protein L15